MRPGETKKDLRYDACVQKCSYGSARAKYDRILKCLKLETSELY